MKKIIFYYNIKYLAKGFLKPNIKDLIKTAKRVTNNSKRNKWFILMDIMWCRVIHLTDLFEYELFQMYNLNYKQRKTIFTTIHKWAYAKKFNNPEYRDIFNYKDLFYQEYSEFIGREWLKIDKTSKDDLTNFVKNKNFIIAKNTYGGGGKQVFKINITNFKTTDELLNYLLNKNINIVEDLIIQHSKINALYPGSVNTVRIVTFLKNNKVNIMVAYLRIGKDKPVDNIRSGGILIPIDLEKGITITVGSDYNNNVFESHPVTQKKLIGFEIPMWNESVNLVIEAAKKHKEVGIVGWDVAITEKGPVVIEGNYYPASTLYQLPAHLPNKKGKLPSFQKITD